MRVVGRNHKPKKKFTTPKKDEKEIKKDEEFKEDSEKKD